MFFISELRKIFEVFNQTNCFYNGNDYFVSESRFKISKIIILRGIHYAVYLGTIQWG